MTRDDVTNLVIRLIHIFNKPEYISRFYQHSFSIAKVYFRSCQTFILEHICKKGQRLLAINYFCKNVLSKMSGKALNRPLHTVIAADL